MNALAQYRASQTPEQIAQRLVEARQTAHDNRAFREANKHLYKTEYLDSNNWQSLATKHFVRMPNQDEPVTTKSLRKYLKRCNVSVETFNEHYTSMAYFVKNNSTWTAFAGAGLILEIKDSMTIN
jgi:hypothetical protein